MLSSFTLLRNALARDITHRSPSSHLTLAPPSAELYVREGEAYFRSVVDLPAWSELIAKWLSFEARCTVKGVSIFRYMV